MASSLIRLLVLSVLCMCVRVSPSSFSQMSSSQRDSLPDASGLVIAARGLPDYAASTAGNGAGGAADGATATRDRHSSYFSSDGLVHPHDYDRDRENQRSLGEVLQRQPHQSVGFWDPKLNQVRKTVIIQWAGMGKLDFYLPTYLPIKRHYQLGLSVYRSFGQ